MNAKRCLVVDLGVYKVLFVLSTWYVFGWGGGRLSGSLESMNHQQVSPPPRGCGALKPGAGLKTELNTIIDADATSTNTGDSIHE